MRTTLLTFRPRPWWKLSCLAVTSSLLISMSITATAWADSSIDDNADDVKNINNVQIVIHRNGEIDPCSISAIAAKSLLDPKWMALDDDKFRVETQITQLLIEALNEEDGSNIAEDLPSCASTDNVTAAPLGLEGFCDMGPERTVILLDHAKLQRSPFTKSLPCRWFTREGMRITKFDQLHSMVQKATAEFDTNNAEQSCPSTETAASGAYANASIIQIHLYGAPAGRVFMFAPSFVGETFVLAHLTKELLPTFENENGELETPTITLKVLSIQPRVFDIEHVFSVTEAQALVDRALREQSPTHMLKRSTTGTGSKSVNQRRTSDNAFDTHGKVALGVKRRIVEVLGMDEFWAGHDDGLQILRYNISKAYIPHMDYMVDAQKKSPYNFESEGKGGNRFATVLLYMSDMEDEHSGGELVFSKAWPSSKNGTALAVNERDDMRTAIRKLRESGDAETAGIGQGSWEEEMIATCRSRLSVRPKKGRAVLFYSQHPNGEQDFSSKHGGCPVLKGEKWAANLWVWNAPRGDYPGQPLRDDYKKPDAHKAQNPDTLHVTFRNTGHNATFKTAELYYDEAMLWGKIGFGDPPLNANTFEGHRWNVRVDGKIMQEWVIGKEKTQILEI